MRIHYSTWVAASLYLLLSVCRAQTHDFSLLPICAQDCLDSTFENTLCYPLSRTNASCACNDRKTINTARTCFASTCGRKDELRALNLTLKACTDKPIRDKSVTYRQVNLALFTMAVVCLVAQWVVRFMVGRLQLLDEANSFMVLLSNTVLCVVCYKMSWTGLGRDMWFIPFDDITTTLLYFWVSEIAYFSTLGFIKLAFLLFYLQIFPEKRFRQIVWAIIWFQIASMVAFDLSATFVCTPINFAWKQWDGEHTGTCINNNALAFTHAAHSILFDFVTLSLPVTQIWKLHMGMKKKIGVLLMFSVGAFVTIVSILRLKSLVHFANTTDMTWDYLEASLWSVIECQVGIICSCMPSIRLGLSHLFPKIMGSSNRSTARDTGAPSGRSHGHSHGHSPFNPLHDNEINVQTSFRISHTKKHQANDDARSFVQLVEIDADSKSAKSSAS